MIVVGEFLLLMMSCIRCMQTHQKLPIKKKRLNLAEYLDEDFNEILKKLILKKFVWIKRFIHMKIKISFPLKKGIGLSVEYKRIYPNNSLASHVLGFCNIDNEGVEGLEKSMNHLLKGNSDETYNIQLTIDSVIQANAEKALKKACEMDKPETASLILIDGYTGEILSLANYPNFDPNFYSEYQQKTFVIRVSFINLNQEVF